MSQASRVSTVSASGYPARLERLVDVDAHEGPVYVAGEDALYFTSVPRPGPRVDIKRLDLGSLRVSVVRPDAAAANGMALGHDGRLVVCEQLGGALAAVDPRTGERTPLADGLNSPNDVVVKGDGAIWFTDPSYGWLQGFQPRPRLRDGVRRYNPRTGHVTTVAETLDKPNGLCFSPDELTLYVTDSGRPNHVKAFDVVNGRRLVRERVFAEIEPGFPDGIEVDSDGRVYVSSASGVQVFAPGGMALGEIELPGPVNFCFGGPGRDVLFITADTAIYAAHLQAKGP